MSQLCLRILRLEIQTLRVSRGSLNGLFQDSERMAQNSSVSFDDAVTKLVEDLDDQELNSMIAEAETVWPEVARQVLARIETGAVAKQ